MTEPLHITIDELAQRSGLTTRTVRAYQSKGLLAPPTVVGRTGYYSDAHAQRLTMIERLRGRGFSLASIAALIDGASKGKAVGELLGFERAVAVSWSDERPVVMTVAEVSAALGREVTAEQVERSVRLRVVERIGGGEERMRVLMPSVLQLGIQLVQWGMPIDAALDLVDAIQTDFRTVLGRFGHSVGTHILPQLLTREPAELLASVASLASHWRQTLRDAVLALFAQQIDERLAALPAPMQYALQGQPDGATRRD